MRLQVENFRFRLDAAKAAEAKDAKVSDMREESRKRKSAQRAAECGEDDKRVTFAEPVTRAAEPLDPSQLETQVMPGMEDVEDGDAAEEIPTSRRPGGRGASRRRGGGGGDGS